MLLWKRCTRTARSRTSSSLSGAEDLVPVLNDDGSRWTEICTVDGKTTYRIHRYRPRIEVREQHRVTSCPKAFSLMGV